MRRRRLGAGEQRARACINASSSANSRANLLDVDQPVRPTQHIARIQGWRPRLFKQRFDASRVAARQCTDTGVGSVSSKGLTRKSSAPRSRPSIRSARLSRAVMMRTMMLSPAARR